MSPKFVGDRISRSVLECARPGAALMLFQLTLIHKTIKSFLISFSLPVASAFVRRGNLLPTMM